MIQEGQTGGGYLLKYGGCEIPFRIKLAERSQLTINVFPDMRVEVLAPSNRTLDAILARIDRRAKWIVKQWRYFEQYLPTQPDRRYVSGETHLYLGRQFRLKLSQGTVSEVKLVGRFFHIQHSTCGNIEEIRSLLDGWYLAHAQSLFLHRLRQCQENCRTLGRLKSPNITVRKMSRRWGSCTQAGNISLNVDLVKTPIYCIDYVIVHELCHLRVHNHSPAFYRLLTMCMPDWERRKAKLDLLCLE